MENRGCQLCKNIPVILTEIPVQLSSSSSTPNTPNTVLKLKEDLAFHADLQKSLLCVYTLGNKPSGEGLAWHHHAGDSLLEEESLSTHE